MIDRGRKSESAIMANQALSLDVLQRLLVIGVGISVDDFGTGFSSFSNLSTCLSTSSTSDRSFTARLSSGGDRRDETSVRATIDLGHALGLRVVTEGVEELTALEKL